VPDVDTLVIKESFGPYFREECELDPVDILMRVGFEPQQLRYLQAVRNPVQTAASWMRSFAGREHLPSPSAEGFVLAFRQSVLNVERCAELGVESRTVLVEELGPTRAQGALTRTFGDLGFDCHSDPTDWNGVPGYGDVGSTIAKATQPDVFRVPVMGKVKAATRFAYEAAATVPPFPFEDDALRAVLSLHRAASLQARATEIEWSTDR